jgi:hypothetical protein
MNKTLVVWNVVVTVMLAVVLAVKFSSEDKVRAVAEAPKVIRAARLELIDQNGKTKAVLETDAADSLNPKLVFYNDAGRAAAFLTVNSKGYGTMYFQDKKTEGKVSVGYLWGSDTPTPPDSEDPLSSWGIGVRGSNGVQTSFGLLNNGQPIPGCK